MTNKSTLAVVGIADAQIRIGVHGVAITIDFDYLQSLRKKGGKTKQNKQEENATGGACRTQVLLGADNRQEKNIYSALPARSLRPASALHSDAVAAAVAPALAAPAPVFIYNAVSESAHNAQVALRSHTNASAAAVTAERDIPTGEPNASHDTDNKLTETNLCKYGLPKQIKSDDGKVYTNTTCTSDKEKGSCTNSKLNCRKRLTHVLQLQAYCT